MMYLLQPIISYGLTPLIIDEPMKIIDLGSISEIIKVGFGKFMISEVVAKRDNKDISLKAIKDYIESYEVAENLKSCGRIKRYLQITVPGSPSPIKILRLTEVPPIGHWRLLDKNQKRNALCKERDYQIEATFNNSRETLDRIMNSINLDWDLRTGSGTFYSNEQILTERLEVLATLWTYNSLYK